MMQETGSVGYGRGSADPAGRIVRSARRLFFSEGFDRVTVERLAKEAGVSKSTLYKYFGDMPGVLRAVAENEADRFAFVATDAPRSAEELKDHLIETGAALLSVIDEPQKIQFDRLVLEQARGHPDLAETYYLAIYERTQIYLSEYIREGQALGLFRSNVSASTLADQLLSMWLGLARARAVLGVATRDELAPEDRSREAVLTLIGTPAA